jgi:hypothetical protein
VDTAVLVVTRRDPPLLPIAVNQRYVAFVARAFRSKPDAHTVGVDQWVERFRTFDRQNRED